MKVILNLGFARFCIDFKKYIDQAYQLRYEPKESVKNQSTAPREWDSVAACKRNSDLQVLVLLFYIIISTRHCAAQLSIWDTYRNINAGHGMLSCKPI